MLSTSAINNHREKITDLTETFSIKNFVLKNSSEVFKGQSLEEPFTFDGFIFTICLKGEATFRLNHREYLLTANSVHAYTPGQIFTLVKRSDDLILESLFLSADYVLQLPVPADFELLKRMGTEPTKKISEEEVHDMIELHAMVAKSHNKKESGFREHQTRALVFTLLMEMAGHYSTPAPKTVPNKSRLELLTDDFFKLLFESFRKERKVSYYADKLSLTPKYLSMTVKKVTGHPISSWINEMVIIEAKRLLNVTGLTVLQISEELHFPNPSFFGRFFKQHTGMTPLQYKNS